MRILFIICSLLLILSSCEKENLKSGEIDDPRPDYLDRGDLIFRSQAEIDSFGVKYSDKKKTVYGYLLIEGEDINNLKPLSTIVSAKKDLLISGTSLSNLAGLNGIDSIAGSFSLRSNNSLLEIKDINPDYVNTDIRISNNLLLQNINAFHNIKELKGNLEISENMALQSVKGFEKLKIIGGNFFIGSMHSDISNNSLIEISTPNLTEVKGNLELIWNHSLRSLNGLNNLETVGGLLRIDLNRSLPNLVGLGRVKTTKNLYIQNNASLRTLEGLDALSDISGQLRIIENDLLYSLEGMPNLLNIGNFCWIHDNPILTSLSGLEDISYINDLWIKLIGPGPFDFCPIKESLEDYRIRYFIMEINRENHYQDWVFDNCN